MCSGDVFSLGVADGVYMWATQGIDAGEFSRSLMQTAKATVEAGGTADVLNGAHAAPHSSGTATVQAPSLFRVSWWRPGGEGEELATLQH